MPVVRLLEEHGPSLRFPYSSGITGSKHSHMRELRIQHEGRPYRVLYTFDPRRTAILLIGGDKTGRIDGTRNLCRLRTGSMTNIQPNSNGRVNPMARKFSELVEKMPAESRARAEATAKKLIAEYALDELREARSMTQTRLAEILGKDQSVISRIEKRTDMYVSTLADFIRAMGGELEIRAVFPEGSVRIRKFGDIAA